MKVKNIVKKTFTLFIAFTHLYYVFRYPLKYGSASTSGTYSATPLPLQLGKYVVVATMVLFLICVFLYQRDRFRLSSEQKAITLATVFMAAHFVVFTPLNSDGLQIYDVGIAIETVFFIPIVIIFSLYYDNSINRYSDIIIYFLLYHLLYTAIQVALYLSVGRLPNIAWVNFVRFGGGWDTPNAFGMFVVLPFLISLARRHYENWAFYTFTTMSSIILILLTVSLTAIAVFVGAFGLFLLLTRRWKTLGATALGALGIVGFVVLTPPIYDLITFVIEMKSASIAAHKDSLALGRYVEGFTLMEFLGGDVQQRKFSESTYVYVLSNFGLVGVFSLLSVVGLSVGLGLLKINAALKWSRAHADLLAAYVTFIVAFAIGAINLPFFSMFPVNVYFWFAVVMVGFTSAGCSDVPKSSRAVAEAG